MKLRIPIDRTLTRLQVGMVVMLDGVEHRIDLVNDCRARAVPLKKKKVSYTTLLGQDVSFEANGRAKNISPESEIPILRWERSIGSSDGEADRAVAVNDIGDSLGGADC